MWHVDIMIHVDIDASSVPGSQLHEYVRHMSCTVLLLSSSSCPVDPGLQISGLVSK